LKQDQAEAAMQIALSDGSISFKTDSKRTVKFQFERTRNGHWRARVISPFHSRFYGTCAQAPDKRRAVKALKDTLVRDFCYIGKVLLTNLGDDADNVGVVNPRLVSDNAKAAPITRADACGAAGQ